jgi:hypothetical protein
MEGSTDDDGDDDDDEEEEEITAGLKLIGEYLIRGDELWSWGGPDMMEDWGG